MTTIKHDEEEPFRKTQFLKSILPNQKDLSGAFSLVQPEFLPKTKKTTSQKFNQKL